ncbi:MAG: AbgT family transporter, partial [Bacilli bacterium]|nr:AbgT family transporter [Bacilli bacterium]
MEEEKIDKKKSWFNNAIIFFVFAIIIVFVLSILGSLLNWEGTYLVNNAITGNLESKLVSVESLFSREGIRYIVGNVVSNFINFKPLAMFLFIMIGIGFAEKTGLFSYLFQSWTKKINKFWLTFIVVLLSILSNLIGEV